jgi:hypothetical protein
MLSYETVMRIPHDIRMYIINAIDTRDHIIDNVLGEIEKKHQILEEENEMLKKQIIECEEKVKTKNNDEKKQYVNVWFNTIGHDSTSNTKKNDDICELFENYNYVYVDNSDVMPMPNIHKNIYDLIHGYIDRKGHQINLMDVNNDPVNKLIHGDDLLSIDAVDALTSYGPLKRRPKKILSSLANILTDYVSDNVHVEKVLQRLDTIIDFMNNDREFIKYVFKGLINQNNEKGHIGIIFKGGNVYKLFSEILDRNLDASIFSHYLSEINEYFKKSDCDFSIVLIATNRTTNEKRFVHLNRTDKNESLICTLQYMILNKFRNDFLHDNNGYEYLNICGINDKIIMKKMKNMGDKMTSLLHEKRLEFESKLFTLMIDSIIFESMTTPIEVLDDFKSLESIKKNTTITWSSPDTQTLRGILKLRNYDFVNRGSFSNVTNGSLLDWYDVFLFYCTRSDNASSGFSELSGLFGLSGLSGFSGLSDEMIKKIHLLETDSMQWKDLKILYNMKKVTNIIIGDKNYQLDKTHNDDEIFRNILSIDNQPDKISEILALRMQRHNGLTSNRNDFFIKFSKNQQNTLNINRIPFDDNKKNLSTPFYISINKEIIGENAAIHNKSDVPYWLRNMKRYSDYGSSGYVDKSKPHSHSDMYQELMNYFGNGKHEKNTINFGLGRLMLSFSIIVKTYDNHFIALPVSGEYIDISYSYMSDLKTLVYENYHGYMLLNDHILGHNSFETIVSEYNNIIEYAKMNNVDSAILSGLYELNHEIIKDNPLIVSELEKIIKPININLDTLFKLLKYYNFSPGANDISHISFNTIHFPKLSGFILDLYSILFIDSEYPWTDQKYAKRLQRFIFFTFVEQLQITNLKNLDTLVKDIGLEPGVYRRMKRNRSEITSGRPQVTLDGRYEVDMNDTFRNLHNYNESRTTILNDHNVVFLNNNHEVESVGAIDRFLFGYHLIDFLSIYQHDHNGTYIRLQFIVKHLIDGVDSFVLLSVSHPETEDSIKKIIMNIPNTKNDFLNVIMNPRIRLPNNTLVNQCEIIDGKFLKYIETVCMIREKLMITIFNYVNREILNSRSQINMIPVDPIRILLNTYEGDIDKILTVVS